MILMLFYWKEHSTLWLQVWWKDYQLHLMWVQMNGDWGYQIISYGQNIIAVGPLWSLLLWSGFTLAAQAWQTNTPLLAICSDSSFVTLVFIFRCCLWNLLCFSDELHKRLMPIYRRFSSSTLHLSPWQTLQAVLLAASEILLCLPLN